MVDISMVVMSYDIEFVSYDRGTLELSYAPFHMIQDTTSIEKKTLQT